jgi:TolB-like protein/DNA-binding winged helix-turn-helix (wHTH) protein
MTGGNLAPKLVLNLLGGFALSRADGAPAALKTRKAELLLAFLALPAEQAHSRDKLAALLWAERGEAQARGSLRTALAELRALLNDELVADRDMVRLASSAVDCDVDLLAQAAQSSEFFETHLLGELLEGCPVPSEEFGEWLTFERNRCRGYAVAALNTAIEAQDQRGNPTRAIELARRLVAFDPLREQSHRLLIRLLAAAGERSLAMAQYQSLKEILKRELNVEPSRESSDLVRSLTTGETVAANPEPEPTGHVPSRFSIAVLPFVNMSGDPAQQSLAEGLAEDLITEFSKARDFAVIARQSAFQYSGRAESAAAAASDLAARYAVTGSLRMADGRFRVSVQLTDAALNRCIWAERFDRPAGDIFRLEDEIVEGIAGQIDATVRKDERERLIHRQVLSLDAWELFHRGLWHIYRFQPEDIRIAEDLFQRSAKLAPEFGLPRAGLAYAAFVKCMFFLTNDQAGEMQKGLTHAAEAVEVNSEDAFSRTVYGRILIFTGALDAAVHHLRQAITTNPSFAQAHYGMAQALAYAARPEEALEEIGIALKLSPRDPLISQFSTLRSFCFFSLGCYAEAEEAARRACQLSSRETISRLAHAVALVELNRLDEAREAAAEARRIQPNLTPEGFARVVAFTPKNVRERITVDLAKVGMDVAET